jgi:GT2 family glycosyltransferase
MKCAVVSLQYLEKEFRQTQECLDKLPNLIIKADRKGYLGIAKAFNDAFRQVPEDCKYVWFVTNILFTHDHLTKLIAAMDETGYAAITPTFDSDHPHIRPRKVRPGEEVQEAKFVEFTCPIVRADVFRKFPLDVLFPYDIHDLDWSFRVIHAGYKLGVHYGVQVGHSYLRNNNGGAYITKKRKSLRQIALKQTHIHAAQKYGPNWREMIWR